MTLTLPIDRLRLSWDRDGTWLSLRCQGKPPALPEDLDKPHTLTIEPERKRRSLDANAYLWVLLGKLGAKLGISPEEAYREYIPDVADNYRIIPIPADQLEEWDALWCKGHKGRMTEDIGPCRRTEGYHNVRCFLGSSDYDTAQMSRLIHLVVADCREQGIETKTPAELDQLVSLWGEPVG